MERHKDAKSLCLIIFCLMLTVCSIAGCGEDCCPVLKLPDVLHVRADGKSEYPTIHRAIALAQDGDVVELGDGRFHGPGNRDIDFLGKAITLRSSAGNAVACTIDCGGSEEDLHRGFHFHSGEGAATVVEHITITNGYTDEYGGGILCEDASSPTLRGLIFANCKARLHGGGLCARHRCTSVIESCSFMSNMAGGGGGVSCISASVRIVDCHFERNSGNIGGGLEVWLPGPEVSTIDRCTFTRSDGGSGGAMFFQDVETRVTECISSYNYGYFGGAVFCHEASPVLIRCISFQDTADNHGAALHCQGRCEPHLISCTFTHGYAQGSGSLVHLTEEGNPVFTRCILSFCHNGQAVDCAPPGAIPIFSCSNIFGNEHGDWVECIEDQSGIQGNISADPLFCDPANGDLFLRPDSPCLGDSSACGSMGAQPAGCW